MRPISFKRYRFPPAIIRHAIWLYARFTQSFRDVEELLASIRRYDAEKENGSGSNHPSQSNVSSPSMPPYLFTPSTPSAAPTAFQGASRWFIPYLGHAIRHRMTPVARYIHRN